MTSPLETCGLTAGLRSATPRTRKRAIISPTAPACRGRPGLNQVTVQFIAPSIARATIAGSMSTSSPRRMPSAMIRRKRPLVAIALLDDGVAQGRRERIDLQVRGGAFDVVEQRLQVRVEDDAQAFGGRSRAVPARRATAASMRSSARSWQ